MILIEGGTVLSDRGWQSADVLISAGRIDAIGPRLAGDTVIDASGMLVGPAFVDLHTHLREPGETWKEDIASGSHAAAAGGYGAIVAMPNTNPPLDSVDTVELVLTAGRRVGVVDVACAGALTAGRAGAVPSDIHALYDIGIRLFTDDGDSVADSNLMRKTMEIVASLPGAMVAQHAEDVAQTTGGHMHDGEVSRRLGVGGLPASAEVDVVRRDLDLVGETGGRYHCQHVSSRLTIELIRAAKRAGLPVTAEVAPHHLSFTDTDVGSLHPDFKMYPPLRTTDDRDALREALIDGTIDVVATDHAPHSRQEKMVDFAAAPRGVIGLETAAAAVWEAVGDRDVLFRSMSSAPATIAGFEDQGLALGPGRVANVVVFDPDAEWRPTTFRSKSDNSPYRSRLMKGKVAATIHGGEITYQDGDR